MFKLEGLGRITEWVETPGRDVRSITLTAVLDGTPLTIMIETTSPDQCLEVAAKTADNIKVEVAR